MVQIEDTSFIDNLYLPVTSYVLDDIASMSLEDTLTTPSQSLRRFYMHSEFDMMELNIALADWGVASWSDNHLTEWIQPTLLRSPEVIIGAPWCPSTDIWNLGAVVIEIAEAVRLIDGRGPDVPYGTIYHLSEMEGLFGPFPSKLLERGNQKTVSKYFTPDGHVNGPSLEKRNLEVWVEGYEGEEKTKFVAFLQSMLKLDPDERKTAKELLQDPTRSLDTPAISFR